MSGFLHALIKGGMKLFVTTLVGIVMLFLSMCDIVVPIKSGAVAVKLLWHEVGNKRHTSDHVGTQLTHRQFCCCWKSPSKGRMGKQEGLRLGVSCQLCQRLCVCERVCVCIVHHFATIYESHQEWPREASGV